MGGPPAGDARPGIDPERLVLGTRAEAVHGDRQPRRLAGIDNGPQPFGVSRSQGQHPPVGPSALGQEPLVRDEPPPLLPGGEDVLDQPRLAGARRIERLAPILRQGPEEPVPVGVMPAGQATVVCLPAKPQRRDVEAVLRAALVGALGHDHGLGGLPPVVLDHHGTDEIHVAEGLDRVEGQPVVGVENRPGRSRRGIGVDGDDVRAAVAFLKPAGKLPADGHVRFLGAGVHRPDDLGHVLVSLRDPARPRAGVRDVDLPLHPGGVLNADDQNHTFVAAAQVDGPVHVLEVPLIGPERVAAPPGQLPLDVLQRVHPDEHDLKAGEPQLDPAVEDSPDVVQGEQAQQLPLGVAEPEERLAVGSDEVPAVVADENRGGLSCRLHTGSPLCRRPRSLGPG